MPRGLNRGNGSFRNGTALDNPTFGITVTTPRSFGNEVTWSPSPTHFGNEVNWVPSPAHFGNEADSNAPPFIESISPAKGNSGQAVTITGTGFLVGATVLFGYADDYSEATAVVVVSSNEITCTSPTAPATSDADNTPVPPVNVIVMNTDGIYGILGNSFTFLDSMPPSSSYIVQADGISKILLASGSGALLVS